MTPVPIPLQTRRARALRALEVTCDIAVCLNEAAVVTYASAASAAALGLDEGQLVGAAADVWLQPMSAADLTLAVGEPRSTTGPSGSRFRVWRRTGQGWRSCHISLTDLRDDPDVAAFVVVGIDETGAAGDAGAVSQFLDSLAIGLLTLDETGTVLYASPPAAALLGHAAAHTVLGTRPFDGAVRLGSAGRRPEAFDASALTALPEGDLIPRTRLGLKLPAGQVLWVSSRWMHVGSRVHVWLQADPDPGHPGPTGGDGRLAVLLGGAGDYVAVLDADGQVTWASPSTDEVLTRLGVRPDAGALALLHPDDMAEPGRLWAAVQTGDPGVHERGRVRVRRPGGGWQLVEVTLTNHLHDPALAGFLVHARDVSDLSVSREIRRGTQEALLVGLDQTDPQPALEAACESLENLLRSHFPTAAVAILHLGLDADGSDVSHAATGPHAAAHLTTNDVLGLPDLTPEPADTPGDFPAGALCSPGRLTILHGHLETRGAVPFNRCWTVPLTGPTGGLGVLRVLLCDDDRAPDALALRALDRFVPLATLLVARHRQQTRTTQSEARFRSVFHDTAIPSALVSDEGEFTAVNAALCALLEAPAAELVGARVSGLEVQAGPDPRGCYQWQTRSGRHLWIQRTAADVVGPDGEARYRAEHYVDVTSERTSEDEVRLLNELLCARITELDAARDRLAAAFRKITRVREDERRALAVHLHDDPVQQLIGARWALDDLDASQPSPEVQLASEAIDGAIDSIRAIITDLRPPSLDVISLPAALEQRAHKLLGDEVLVEVVDELSEPVPDDLSALVFRTVSEALANVRKHAGAGRVVVALGNAGDTVVAKVADDGVGFDVTVAAERARAGHLGVTSMREQILLAGGRFYIGPRADGQTGTEVSFALPRLVEDAESPAWPMPRPGARSDLG